ncbi:hypothetical protein K458DRAFT_485722 [Lentithecium fluviatile CBS 122367]|uniref:AA1-like domain-containing protein n=1 Tax=Lentithecium fluviatile CBS 122367 TaxID=1168545 RepID=A0A6G1J8C6_9PLEO|nr:hypothetical protein K458DRAFT_485722 [Lentithecium fluviatile CBS 122367]
MVALKAFILLAFTHLALSRPSPPPAFQVTNLNTFEPTGRPQDTSPYRVGFNVTDPSASAMTFCEARWPYAQAATGYPSKYLANCTNKNWAFKFVGYKSYYDFVLDVKHTRKTHGKKTTKFAKGSVSLDVVKCVHAASGFSSCNQIEGVKFPLEVYDERRG